MDDLNSLTLEQLQHALGVHSAAKLLAARSREEDMEWGEFTGDITSAATQMISTELDDRTTRHVILSTREPARVAGIDLIRPLSAAFLSSPLDVETLVIDGSELHAGEPCAHIRGSYSDVLAFERTLLNLLSYLFGVATTTAKYVMQAAASAGDAKVLDTRKTLPGYRVLSKYAVRCGGGWLHRVNLADAVLIKDNHIAGISDAELGAWVRTTSEYARRTRPVRFIEVEVDRLSQLESILHDAEGYVDYVLLDNMDDSTLKDAVSLRNTAGSDIKLEASGGMTLDRVTCVASTGVERISVGAITQRSVAIDLGLDVQ